MDVVRMEGFTQFIENVKRIKETHSNVIFRGIIDYNKNNDELAPKLFREENLNIVESDLINGVLSELPDEFRGIESNLEILLKLQHYGIPTRLLDVSFNPYISLYFSCDSATRRNQVVINEEMGIVYVIAGNKLERKTIFSDKISIMSSLSRLADKQKEQLEYTLYSYLRMKIEIIIWYMSVVEKEKLIHFLEEEDISGEDMIIDYFWGISRIEEFDFTPFMEKLFSNAPVDELIEIIESTELTLAIFEDYFKKSNERVLNDLKQLEIKFNEFMNYILENNIFYGGHDRFKNAEKRMNKIYNHLEPVKRLIHEVRNYKPGFQNELILDDLCKDYLIVPHKTNERIKNQQGGFVLKGFGSGNDFLSKDYILEKWEIPFEIMGVIPMIDGENLLKDLSTMNIDNSFIYPELEHYNIQQHRKN